MVLGIHAAGTGSSVYALESLAGLSEFTSDTGSSSGDSAGSYTSDAEPYDTAGTYDGTADTAVTYDSTTDTAGTYGSTTDNAGANDSAADTSGTLSSSSGDAYMPDASGAMDEDGVLLEDSTETAETTGSAAFSASATNGARTTMPDGDAPFNVWINFGSESCILTEQMTSSWRAAKNGRFVWDVDKVKTYLQKLADKYDHDTEIQFVSHSGNLVDVPNYFPGWYMDIDSTASTLMAEVDQGSMLIYPEWENGLSYSTASGVGRDYVEVDITNQTVFLYINGALLFETPCVTGMADGYSDTRVGIFQMYSKASPYTLRDKSPNGYEYATPVDYWMPFDGSRGLHDANWRAAYGGNIYTYDGSYGCVNLPPDSARFLYANTYVGMPVIVHY